MMKRILLIGAGSWGANHLRVLKSMPIELHVANHNDQRLSSAIGCSNPSAIGSPCAG
jgi:hypothetical protein